MADDKKKSGDFAFPSTGMLAVALAVIGLIWSGPAPLIDERPVGHMGSDNDAGQIQDIDARLWQDPLGALEQGAKQADSSGRHSPNDVTSNAFDNEGKLPVDGLQMLAVMVPGGPYPEQEEGRRRSRYAVLSALATLGYTPEDSEHIGYFKVDVPAHPSLPEQIPFEFFEKESDHATRRRIFVLWLDDSKFSSHIDERISTVFGLVSPPNIQPNLVARAVIGPNKSSLLKTILKEANGNNVSRSKINYYAAGATVSNAKAAGSGAKINPADTFHPAQRLWRTIANDEMVSDALVQELGLRQVDPGNDRILLISEWDTLYGQAFPDTFAASYMHNKDAECLPMTHGNKGTKGHPDSNVYCINYMRGIDGLLPDETTRNKEPAQDAQKKPETIQLNNNIDRPSGNYQQDYLRRLVDRVRRLDQLIRDRRLPCPVRNNGIAAIGVVGTDVYDKLMILQALRPYFPGKLFFTTDLDAAYFSAREQQFTHNLIVGSAFGLTLAPELQKSIPPFRDSYQTSMFLSAELATSAWEGNEKDADIAQNLSKWLAAPRIFEIGRKNAVDLSPEDASQSSAHDKAGDCQQDVMKCARVYPTPDITSRSYTSMPVLALKLSAVILTLLLFYRMNWLARKFSDKLARLTTRGKTSGLTSCPGKNDLRSMSIFVLAGTAILGIAYWFVASLGRQEPFSLVGGVSIWPSNLLQLIALILSLLALRNLMQRLAETDKEMRNAFLKPGSTDDVREPPELTALECILAVHKWEASLIDDRQLDVEKLWKRYVEYGQTRYRILRATMGTTIFVLFGTAVIMLTGGQPVPSRGNFSFYTDVTLEILCVISTVFLIMWIVDAARLSSRLIALIATDKPSKWPTIGMPKWGWSPAYNKHVPYWIDVEFVACYTKATETFIWYPIPPLLLLGMARSTIFDNWTFSPGLLVSIIILLVYLFSVAFILQHVAKDMRNKATEKLKGALRELRCTSVNNEQKIAQLEKMTGEVKNNEEGALTPFLHQPMIQALLAFLSGSGGVAILMERFF